MWVFRAAGLLYLGSHFWLRALPELAWVGLGALTVGALVASVLERRRHTLDTTLFGLIIDYSLVSLVLWSVQGTAWAYWLLFIPLLYALFRSGAHGAFLGGVGGAGATYLASFLQTGNPTPEDPMTLSWMVGVVVVGAALGWLWRRRVQFEQDALLQQAEQAVSESESAERRIRENYRELAHHYHRLEEHLAALQDAAELLQAIQQARAPNTLYQAILERLRARFSATGAALYLSDESGAQLRVVCAISSLARLEQMDSLTPIRPFQKEPSPQQVADKLRAEVIGIERLAEAHGIPLERPDAIVQPLVGEGRILGVVVLSTRTEQGFPPETRTRLRALTPYLTGLLELTEQLRLMGVRLAETQLLYEMENLLFCAETLQSLPQHALTLLKTVLPYEHAQLLVKRNDSVEIAAQIGALPDLRTVLPGLNKGDASALPQRGYIFDSEHDSSSAFAPAKSLLVAPLRGGTRSQGVIVLGRSETPPFNEQDLELLQTLSFQMTNVLERAQLLSDLERLATTDGLTGLYNYRHFQERYREEIRLCQRYQHPLAIMIIDLDGFKQVNDQYGHLEGDYLLVQLAETLRDALRNTEFIARYGGDEFVVLMHATNLQGGVAAAKRVVQAVRETQYLNTQGQPCIKISVSIGVAAYPNSTEDPAEVLEKADEALEIAKRSGRNQVVALENTA
ncbi:MAG: GGDEF domain-containing protein [Fimbriimonadales bacterium]|nr:GGDEF domain-containing protein [Fimbriimonadales bacterium]